MTEDRYQLAIIIASVRSGRFGPTVADWFVRRTQARDDLELDVIDLAELTLPADFGRGGDASMFAKRIGAADAVVVVTPEYNHGYPGALKTAIDTLRTEWHAKPVGFVCYGGMSGGLRAVEQLRAVFAEVQAVTIRNTVSFHQVRAEFGPGGEPHHPERVDAAADVLLNQLGWWARALRRARDAEPYHA